MPATVATPTYSGVPGDRKVVVAIVTGDTSYPTGGYALTASQFGLSVITDMIPGDVVGIVYTSAGSCVWNAATSKLQFYTSAGAETTNATNVSAASVKMWVCGY